MEIHSRDLIHSLPLNLRLREKDMDGASVVVKIIIPTGLRHLIGQANHTIMNPKFYLADLT